MLTMAAISAGSVEYLLRGSGCAEHQHAAQKETGGAGYMLAGAEKEAAGVWFGTGLKMLGMEAGTAATEEHVRAAFGRLEHPTRVDENGDAVALGNRPRKFRSRQERVAAALASEPDASDERITEIENAVRADTAKAVAYYDLTFSPAKSVSVYWAALMAEGREDEAGAVVEAHHAAIASAMDYVEREASFVRSGHHGKTASGRSVGVYEEGEGLSWLRWDHSTSRAQQPQLHSHVTVLNRTRTRSDGEIRAVDGKGFRPIKQGADAIYRQTLERVLSATNGVVFALRPDGKSREIMGIDQQLRAKASSRDAQITKSMDDASQRFEEAYGRAPSPAERKKMHHVAWRDTREAKNYAVAPRQQIRNWATGVRGELSRALKAVEGHAVRVTRYGHPDQQGYAERSRAAVLQAAVAAVQAKYSTWEIGNLEDEIEREQLRTPSVSDSLHDLAREVLRDGDKYGLVLLTAPDVAPVPAAAQREDGKSKYRPQNLEWWTTVDQLSAEERIVARARQVDAPTVAGPELELLRVELDAAGLSVDQQDAVLDVLSSGRRGDVLIGPAGTGKSRTVGALARVWPAGVGGRVFGLATSEIATRVLAEDGLTALNTTVFLQRFAPDTRGHVRERLQPGDLVVVDEAGMSSTAELEQISRIAGESGAKVVYTGDHEQLVAVGAGGMLELLVRDAGAIELTEVHRFRNPWEKDASVRLRAADPTVLAVYDEHGRIHGGTEQEMTTAAGRGYLADVLEGKTSLLVVRDNDTATELSGQIRSELVAAGKVGQEVLGETRDGNLIGVGDRIQARRNNYDLRVDGPGAVLNRDVFTVLGRDAATGNLRVQKADGLVAHLPASYTAESVTLAYAVTVNASQGVTVDTTHGLIPRNLARFALYVTGSRGRESNTFYVVSQQHPDAHSPERIDGTALGVLGDILSRPVEGDAAAELARRAGEEEGRSLAWVGTQWDLVTAEYARDRYTDTLTGLLGTDRMDAVVSEPRYDQLISALRGAELNGHNPDAVLEAAFSGGRLDDADSVSDVLRYRVRLRAGQRTPERVVQGGDWTTFADPVAGPVGEFAQRLAEVATTRQHELGVRAAADPPEWALRAPTLGVPASGGPEREEWIRRAGIVAAYRDLHSIADSQESIGAAPERRREFHHALWVQAHAALGYPSDSLDFAVASDSALREMREAWRREQTWAPPHVRPELSAARELAEEYRRDAVIWRAGLEQHSVGSAGRGHAERDLAAAEKLASLQAARVAALESIAEVRREWHEQAEPIRIQASFAGDELERRGLDRDPVAPSIEQNELFTLDDRRPLTRERAGRATDPAQHQLDLDGVPGREALSAAELGERAAAREAAQSPTTHEPADAADHDVVQTAYQEVFDESLRDAAREAEQPGLFPVAHMAADVAAAQPLRAAGAETGRVSGRETAAGRVSVVETATSRQEDAAMTVGQAKRIAVVSRALRAELAAATPERSSDPEHTDLGVGAPSLSDAPEQRVSSAERSREGQGLGR